MIKIIEGDKELEALQLVIDSKRVAKKQPEAVRLASDYKAKLLRERNIVNEEFN